MSTVLIIPARGGSKRIPRKNIIEFAGKPMIAWTIDAALQSKLGDVYVSTDDMEIAEVSHQYGARVFLRSACADDQSTVSDAMVYTLQNIGKEYDTVIQLLANCPLRTAQDIIDVYDWYAKGDAPSVISAFRYGWMNPWWALKCAGKPLFPKEITMRSQDLPALYCPTGAVWVADVPALQKHKTFYMDGYDICVIPWQSAVDIDEKEDMDFALAIKHMQEVKKV